MLSRGYLSGVGEGGFDVLGVFAGHSDISSLGSLGIFGFAEIVVILFSCTTNHFAAFGDFDFLCDGFPSFLLHRCMPYLGAMMM